MYDDIRYDACHVMSYNGNPLHLRDYWVLVDMVGSFHRSSVDCSYYLRHVHSDIDWFHSDHLVVSGKTHYNETISVSSKNNANVCAKSGCSLSNHTMN